MKKKLKNQVINSRVTLDEKKQFAELATCCNANLSEWIRETLNCNHYSNELRLNKENLMEKLDTLELTIRKLRQGLENRQKPFMKIGLDDTEISSLIIKLMKIEHKITDTLAILNKI